MGKQRKELAIVGSGPAALMAADVITGAGVEVEIFEKHTGPGRKLLIAGSTGLNVTNSLPFPDFLRQYSGAPMEFWEDLMAAFSPQRWIQFLGELGVETFEGTSGRYLIKDETASKFVLSWRKRLVTRGASFNFAHEVADFRLLSTARIRLDFLSQRSREFDAVCFCVGGGSYEAEVRWPGMFRKKPLAFEELRASNVGYRVAWTEAFLAEAEGKPLKNVVMTSSRGARQGDAVITKYGIEGTPVYFVGETGPVTLDLMVDLTADQIIERCNAVTENLSPLRRANKKLKLGPATQALLFHFSKPADVADLARLIKAFPLTLLEPRPLAEAISTAGGLSLNELDKNLMLKKFPGVFAAGEMLAWDAPTGGYLIQACVSQGHRAGTAMLAF